MSNLDAPSGFNPVGKIGSGPASKMSEYNVTSDDIFQGDIVKLASGVIVQGAAADTAFVGVFWGANYDDSTGKPVFVNQIAAGQAAVCFVYDDPYQVFEIQGDGASAQTDIGDTADIVVAAGNTTNGISGMELDSSDIGTGINLRIVNYSKNPARSDIGSANLLYEVLINEHLYK
tara:strand:+ start:65 stop:589 length:525 start_codon:yes stop_codon:yes gene_type:complete